MKENDMKKIIASVIAAAALVLGLAAPAQAAPEPDATIDYNYVVEEAMVYFTVDNPTDRVKTVVVKYEDERGFNPQAGTYDVPPGADDFPTVHTPVVVGNNITVKATLVVWETYDVYRTNTVRVEGSR